MKQSTYLRKVISALKNAGWILIAVDDGEGREKVSNTQEAMKIVSDVEIATLIFENATIGKRSSLLAVWQGPDDEYEEGEEIVADYGMSLDPIISKIGVNENPRRKARKNPRGVFPRAGDSKTLATFTDKELSHMISVTKGAAKNAYLKEAGRRVAAEHEKRHGKSTRKNPPIFTSGKRKTRGTAHLIGLSVYEIRYRHAADGLDYKHPFETNDVLLLGMPDGSLKIESATGKRLWENFDV